MTETADQDSVLITTPDATLPGFLDVPAGAAGVVVFAHGSGSSRFSRRNNAVAAYLREAGLGTLLFDLLTAEEESVDSYTREHRFDIPLLSRRLEGAVNWLAGRPVGALPIGLFGSSTGAAAALIVAAALPDRVRAVVARGGRVDLAADCLDRLRVPALFIVGGRDDEVMRLNRAALRRLPGTGKLAVVEGATHLFEEPGALARVQRLARDFFVSHLVPVAGRTDGGG